LSDTHPKAEKVLIEGLRRMTPAQKWRQVREMNLLMDALVRGDVRRRHPHADEREVALRVASRRLPAELMRRAFGWDPDEKGY
jgi:hypothetical protein